MMNFPELKLPSSSSSIHSVASTTDEDEEAKEGNKEGSQTVNNNHNNTNNNKAEDNEKEQQQEESSSQQQKLTEHHPKNYLNSKMGGKDLCILFAMKIGCHSRDLPDHKEPSFSQSKVYHSEVKPDASTL